MRMNVRLLLTNAGIESLVVIDQRNSIELTEHKMHVHRCWRRFRDVVFSVQIKLHSSIYDQEPSFSTLLPSK